MESGLFWLVLLVVFICLAWLGGLEYQKIEAYQAWAQQFERAKYDIYAVLGQNGHDLTWGKPTRKGPVSLITFSLEQVQKIDLQVDDQPVDLESPPTKGRIVALEFQFAAPGSNRMRVPFTEIPLAVRWAKHLQQCLQALEYEKIN